ncbi:MAG: alpha-galactosidase [Clostridia bacterium]
MSPPEGRGRTENRNQLVLDLSRAEVRQYLVESVSRVLGSANIEYVKWDCNRNITETQTQMQYHQYVLGLYEVLERLTSQFPHVLFEGCSGGGGRFDAGMLYYMPQTWTSDHNTTGLRGRYRIQYGTSRLHPPGLLHGGPHCQNQSRRRAGGSVSEFQCPCLHVRCLRI